MLFSKRQILNFRRLTVKKDTNLQSPGRRNKHKYCKLLVSDFVSYSILTVDLSSSAPQDALRKMSLHNVVNPLYISIQFVHNSKQIYLLDKVKRSQGKSP